MNLHQSASDNDAANARISYLADLVVTGIVPFLMESLWILVVVVVGAR